MLPCEFEGECKGNLIVPTSGDAYVSAHAGISAVRIFIIITTVNDESTTLVWLKSTSEQKVVLPTIILHGGGALFIARTVFHGEEASSKVSA